MFLWCEFRLSLFVFVLVQSSRRPNFKELNSDMVRYQRWLLNNNSKAFYTPVVAEDLRQGTQYLLQVCVCVICGFFINLFTKYLFNTCLQNLAHCFSNKFCPIFTKVCSHNLHILYIYIKVTAFLVFLLVRSSFAPIGLKLGF